MSKTFITYLLPKSGWKSPRFGANVVSRKGAWFVSALEVLQSGPDDDLANFHVGRLFDGVSDRASD